jgi:integrase/recombinase XerD
MLKALETELKIRGCTPATLKAYRVHNQRFLDYIKKEPEVITQQDVKKYLAHLMADLKQKPASVNLTLSALKFFYETLLKKKIFEDIKPPKKENKLPTVLTKQEIRNILEATKNSKHKLLIELLYSSGLRVSEAVNMQLNELDLEENMGRVIAGKGKKDRNIILSKSLIKHLQKYLKKRKHESNYIFPGEGGRGSLSIRMAQKIVQKAAYKAGIKRRVFCHALRSSFATHLLEDGVDIRYIQELLGHASISTTEKYTRVSTEQLKKIKSPFDNL